HIVRTSRNIFNPAGCTSAPARLIHQPCKISCAVSDKGQCLFAQTGHDEFSKFSRRKHLFCLRINNLWNKPVLVDVHTAEFRTFSCNTRATELAHAVILCAYKLVSPYFMHLITHRFSHAFPTEKTDMQL